MATETPPVRVAKPELLLANLQNERDAVHLYRFLADRESDAGRASVLRDMAEMETHHAKVMEHGLIQRGVKTPGHRISFKTRLLEGLARLTGPRMVYPLLTGLELSGTANYATQEDDVAALASDERSHARTLGELSKPRHPETWHRSAGGGTLRAAVFGVSDGLVSNLSLVMGFAGASADAQFVLLAGLSGLVAGAASMAAGEYVSMKAQRELLERQIELEAAELSVNPIEEAAELAMIYRSKGMSRLEAENIARKLIQDPNVALDALVREELGLDPSDLGSPISAAFGSFVAFAIGALLPVIPFFFGGASINVMISLLVSGLGLFTVGALLSLFTGRGMFFSGGRQLVIGAVAAVLTFGLGSVIGVSAG